MWEGKSIACATRNFWEIFLPDFWLTQWFLDSRRNRGIWCSIKLYNLLSSHWQQQYQQDWTRWWQCGICASSFYNQKENFKGICLIRGISFDSWWPLMVHPQLDIGASIILTFCWGCGNRCLINVETHASHSIQLMVCFTLELVREAEVEGPPFVLPTILFTPKSGSSHDVVLLLDWDVHQARLDQSWNFPKDGWGFFWANQLEWEGGIFSLKTKAWPFAWTLWRLMFP